MNNQKIFTVQELAFRKPQKNNLERDRFLLQKKIFIISVLIIFAIFLLLLAITLTLIFVLNKQKNSNLTCAENSTKSGSICICNEGFVGDGLHYCDECGRTYFQPNLRIVGGISANAYSWPSVSLIIFNYKDDIRLSSNRIVTLSFTAKCGGSLINRKTILTAAHCIQKIFSYQFNNIDYVIDVKPNKYYPTIESMYKIYLGVYNISQLNLSPTQEYSVANIKIHENYSDSTKLNDIAILKLINMVDLNENIQITCLPSSHVYPSNNPLKSWSVGWGTTSYLGISPDVLYNVELNIYNSSMCSFVSASVLKDWNSQLCAGEFNGGKDTCQGDSGGPLYVLNLINGKLKYITAGIVSYGDGCAGKYLPGIYTKTSFYIDWIKKYS